MAETTAAERMAHARAVQAQRREEAKAPMDEPMLPAADVALADAEAPTPAPLPDFTGVPAHEPFRYEGAHPLTPADLDIISTFHATYMQGPGIGNDRQRFRQAKRDAAIVLPLMQKQHQLACQGVGGAQSQEARQVERNMHWVEDLLKIEG